VIICMLIFEAQRVALSSPSQTISEQSLENLRGTIPTRRRTIEVAESPGRYEVESDKISF